MSKKKLCGLDYCPQEEIIGAYASCTACAWNYEPITQTETQNSNKNSNVISVSDGVSEMIRCAMCNNPNQSYKGCDGACSYDEKLYKRIMDAINASRVEVSEDCISREDAVNALIAHFIPQTYTGEEVEQASKLARKIMENAPSVVPTTEQSCDTCRHNKLEWDSKECDGCTKANSNYEPTTEQSSLVRCKDCKWSEPNNEGDYDCKCHIPIFRVVSDGYCNKGERKR